MEIIEQDDLVIAKVTRDDVEHDARAVAELSVDVVRLHDNEDPDPAVLDRLGFLTRPRWVNWLAPLGASEEEFTARVSGTERRNIRLGRRAVQEGGLRLSVRSGLTEEVFEEFLPVYDAQLAGMARGKDYARRFRTRLLDNGDEYMSVFVYDGRKAVVTSIWWIRPGASVLQMRFSAAAPSARASRVMRAAYAEAFRFAREHGLSYASLGNDPSLFGHVVQPGLFNFKSRLGFSAVPSAMLDPHLGGVTTDRFVSLRALSDPSLVVTVDPTATALPTWPDAAPSLDLVLLSRSPCDAAGTFRTEGFRSSRTMVIQR
ncbi:MULTISPECIES: GNAT family N-acetyltransferase [Streptomyces]|uniref:GNAT family N-acetyltransferase n=1 Tax=Streptomyces tsukubensis (strain DSM 42081 / NBRC 108919 / NRRL 18488 / 9993) TaxID=1114943 RepID=I2NA65_STRT9|nr:MULTISPECIES: GNAT family N-acetyltransferase [Streptomyces]AZK97695.1 hypothetical protein B7R87_30260 [Streptomyces tsukubensis]EIF93912.1 hypothetical protein [Streptomyces tsukubensis NRRL18488]MYS64346.1 GNAT family N-acetyltransferase [Streptomyces sp. SID5473]QKM66369.1 GNAT family N-acetyltransferase [Streptomyces tsukubensis NRRL18488]TAI45292.1 GNAT family N-acetyltransferase [Streptomyces tsukubensis]